MVINEHVAYGEITLPVGIRSRFIENVNGLSMHILEVGFEPNGRPGILLLHGFPELAYSWRKVMLPLAQAGFHVIAPDQRGYGRTTGWDGHYDGDLDSFRMFNLVRDTVGLVYALGFRSVVAVVGHDFGSPVAAWCALIRPDIFQSVVLMSAPFGGPPPLPFDTTHESKDDTSSPDVHTELAALPRPRKHYQHYYTTRQADNNMRHCPQGVHKFLRAYFHYKSADWIENKPFPLKAWRATELAQLPTYYIMDLDKGMAETVALEMPAEADIAACDWLSEEELRVYSSEYERNGFQGGLQWYRCSAEPKYVGEMQTFSDRTIDVPACFIAGRSDWGVYQRPGNVDRMQSTVCTDWRGLTLVDGAGHWVQQERPKEVVDLLIQFLTQQA